MVTHIEWQRAPVKREMSVEEMKQAESAAKSIARSRGPLSADLLTSALANRGISEALSSAAIIRLLRRNELVVDGQRRLLTRS
jgi:hypothetical protein